MARQLCNEPLHNCLALARIHAIGGHRPERTATLTSGPVTIRRSGVSRANFYKQPQSDAVAELTDAASYTCGRVGRHARRK